MLTSLEMNIAVCDDEKSERMRIVNMTKEILDDAKIPYNMKEYECAHDLLAEIQSGTKFQILLLDVLMDEMDGMELARCLRQQGNRSFIIFVSYNRELAMYGYEVTATRYLAKPVDRDKMKEALLYCYKCLQNKKEILLPTGQGQHRISLSDIQFAEAFERGTRFVLEYETVESKLKFSDVEEMLPKSAFVLCHRSYIVNLAHVMRILPYEFYMKSGIHVPISKYRYKEVCKKVMDNIAD